MKFVYDFGDNWVHDIIIEKEIDEKILDRVIENIKIEEKETLKTLKKEEKQK